MLKIRLQRVGKKNQASFRIILTEHKKSVKGKYQELLGNYNPRTKPSTINLKEDRIKYWLSVGAKPSVTVHNILVDKKIIDAKKIKAWKPKKKEAEEEKKEQPKDVTAPVIKTGQAKNAEKPAEGAKKTMKDAEKKNEKVSTKEDKKVETTKKETAKPKPKTEEKKKDEVKKPKEVKE